MKCVAAMFLTALAFSAPAEERPDDVRYHNVLQWQIKAAVDTVKTNKCTQVNQRKDAVRTAVLSVLKGRRLQELLNAHTTVFQHYRPEPYIGRSGEISLRIGDIIYDLTPKSENGVIVDLLIRETPICVE